MIYIQILVFLTSLMFMHELGHILAAKYTGLQISKFGFQMKPYPHFFVAATWPRTNREKYIYLFAGMSITLTLFLSGLYFNFFSLLGLYIAFAVQIVLETNPFYSDITISITTTSKKVKYGKAYGVNYKKEFSKYQFSNYWYLHFIIWTALIITLIKLNPIS